MNMNELERSLHQLPEAQLVQVRAFIRFLVGNHTAQTDPAPTETAPKPPAEPPRESDGGDAASLAWMLRLLFGDAEIPDETNPLAGNPPHKRLPQVPLIAQQQSEWCWAATTQMILAALDDERFAGDPATVQLELVRSVDPVWRSHRPAHQLNTGGWPPFAQWGFEHTELANPETLSAEQARAEIDAGRPFAISWHYPNGGGHMLVIVGYLWIGDVLWLVAHDPWPAGKNGGDRSLISYDHYVRGLAGTWRTYFGIRPTTTVSELHSSPTPRLGSSPAGNSSIQAAEEAGPTGDSSNPEDPQAPSTQGWEAFLEVLGDSQQRNQAIGRAISLIRALASPGTSLGKDLGVFGADPGAPEHIHFSHAMPVLELPERLDLEDENAMMRVFTSFNRAVVMIGGERGHLTSITVRQTGPGGPWKVIRIGRSHLVQAFHRLNGLLAEGLTFSVGGRELLASRHLTHLPLVMLRMPDARQYLLMMEVVGAPRQDVPFLFFPVYQDPDLGFDPARALTLEDLDKALGWSA